jgi:16S rRNA (guanine966-N2)-methyltransferase
MRIISGRFRGRRLEAPAGDLCRPTSDRVREALFSILSSRAPLIDASVLDLFAGSGALGLEALSRGARSATFVETAPKVVHVLRQNVAHLGVESDATILKTDVHAYLGGSAQVFDLIFVDPPYAYPLLEQVVARARERLDPDGWMIVEHERGRPWTEPHVPLEQRTYGRTTLSFFGSQS